MQKITGSYGEAPTHGKCKKEYKGKQISRNNTKIEQHEWKGIAEYQNNEENEMQN